LQLKHLPSPPPQYQTATAYGGDGQQQPKENEPLRALIAKRKEDEWKEKREKNEDHKNRAAAFYS
jgi:hypothetical protein